ncbi:ankyrin repeat domain-containing protein [Spiroplasma sp. AdecLV25b]|uniref:ankyrin repeat domain-containing protein n=1 Tax=Spiroplasma sp. AdecLV25b TaxID=3027162 RepID=UPI0027DEE565|nr:ankyrin repeat domain-containing protein [Spiroplasma sp. AdecLV25b]
MKKLTIKFKDSLLINALDCQGTPLQLAINGASLDTNGVPEATKFWIGKFFDFNYLLNNVLNYNTNIIDTKTNITKVLVKNYEEIAKHLLSILTREQINSKDNEGDSPIHECVVRSNVKILKLVLDTKKGNINAQNNVENTPLHCAVKISSIPIIELLLKEKGILLELKNSEGKMPHELIFLSDRTDKQEIAELFKEAFLSRAIECPKILLNTTEDNCIQIGFGFNEKGNYNYPTQSVSPNSSYTHSLVEPYSTSNFQSHNQNAFLGEDTVDTIVKAETKKTLYFTCLVYYFNLLLSLLINFQIIALYQANVMMVSA